MQDVMDAYAAAATAHFVAAYECIPPENIYKHVIDLLPSFSAKVADIGAGTGRDAAWFARKGHNVLAVEPVRELRDAGQALHIEANITWLDDRLPHLCAMSAYEPFDLITLCAVWQHLSDGERAIAIPRLAKAIAPEGVLIMSLRHGPGDMTRRVVPVLPEMTIAMADACGLRLVRRRHSESIQASNRAMGVRWT